MHFNGAASFALVPWLRAGVAGATPGDRPRTAEQMVSPCRAHGSRWLRSGQGYLRPLVPFQFVLNGYAEFAAENRSEGLRLSAYAMGVW